MFVCSGSLHLNSPGNWRITLHDREVLHSGKKGNEYSTRSTMGACCFTGWERNCVQNTLHHQWASCRLHFPERNRSDLSSQNTLSRDPVFSAIVSWFPAAGLLICKWLHMMLSVSITVTNFFPCAFFPIPKAHGEQAVHRAFPLAPWEITLWHKKLLTSAIEIHGTER